MSWPFVLLAMIGTTLSMLRLKWCFPFWIASNIGLAYHNWVIGQTSQMWLFGFYLLTSVAGWVIWTRKERER